MYELKKNGKVFTSKSVGTGPARVLRKKYLPGRGLTKVEELWLKGHDCRISKRSGMVSLQRKHIRNIQSRLLIIYQ